MDNAREMIERALMRFFGGYADWWVDNLFGMLIRNGGFFDALAEQAIVMDAEIKHFNVGTPGPETTMLRLGGQHCTYRGLLGTPGKAIAIIVSLGEKDAPS